MFPFRRKKPVDKLPPKPAWLKWLLLAFIGYVMVMANAPQQSKTGQAIQQAKHNITENPAINFSEYKNKIFPEHAAGLRVSDVQEGSGKPAICGQKVSVAYQAYLAQGNELPDRATKDKPLQFTIGDEHVMPVFSSGVLGMKVGGKRSVIAPPLMSYGLEDYRRDDVPANATARFEMELLSLSPDIPSAEASPYRMAEIAIGRGMQVACGDAVRVHITMWDISGKKLFASDTPLAFTIGKSEAMLGLEQGIMGMYIGGTRLLIIPPAYQNTLTKNPANFSLPLPKNQTVMIELKLLPEEKTE